jgi:hypothetical protein
LGFPLCSVVYPVWFNENHALPELLEGGASGNAPLCNKALKLKDQCFPVRRGHGADYLNMPALYNNSGTGIMQKLAPLEDQVFAETNMKLDLWRKATPKASAVKDFYNLLDQQISKQYLELFGL